MAALTLKLPAKAKALLARQACPFCQQTAMSQKDVIAVGNRRSDTDKKVHFCYEVKCPKCLNPMMTIVKEMTQESDLV